MNEGKSLINVSMEIILHAGNARKFASKAMLALRDEHYKEAEELLDEAKESIKKAHIAQTEVIQAEARGEQHEPTLLFTHAQDTLMTIMSELNIYQTIFMLFTTKANVNSR